MARRSNKCALCEKNPAMKRRIMGVHCCSGCARDVRGYLKKNPRMLENPHVDIGVDLGTFLPSSNKSDSPVADLPTFDRAVDKFREFHGVSDYTKETLLKIENGSDEVKQVVLAGLGKVPYISWISPEGRKISFMVEDEKLEYTGFRMSIPENSMPYFVQDPETKEGMIIGSSVRRFAEFADDNGVIGEAPAVEYVVKWKSAKQGNHYVHRYNVNNRPKLVWDPEWQGLRYVGGSYRINNWVFN